MSKQYTDQQRKAIFDVFTLMSILVKHHEYSTIKKILLDLNHYIMSEKSDERQKNTNQHSAMESRYGKVTRRSRNKKNRKEGKTNE